MIKTYVSLSPMVFQILPIYHQHYQLQLLLLSPLLLCSCEKIPKVPLVSIIMSGELGSLVLAADGQCGALRV